MNTKQKIDPQKVTKPIQLLAAWLVGLIIVNGSFLTAASLLEAGSLERVVLVVASVINVPIFLIAMFLLQTRFRPELQEDAFYSQYLNKKTNKLVKLTKDDKIEIELTSIRKQIEGLVNQSGLIGDQQKKLAKNAHSQFRWRVSLNDHLDNFDEIRKALKSEKIVLSEIFGSTNTDEKPDRKVISISPDVDFDSKKRILLLGSRVGMEGYDYFDPEEQEITEQILIGSYGYRKGSYIPLEPKLIQLLESDPDPIDLQYYEAKNRKRSS